MIAIGILSLVLVNALALLFGALAGQRKLEQENAQLRRFIELSEQLADVVGEDQMYAGETLQAFVRRVSRSMASGETGLELLRLRRELML